MKKNLKFLIAAIVSIVSVSAVTGSAMQNNPDGGDNRYKKYEELIENQDQEQNVNSNNSEQNIFEKSEEEKIAANKKNFKKYKSKDNINSNSVDKYFDKISQRKIKKNMNNFKKENFNKEYSNILKECEKVEEILNYNKETNIITDDKSNILENIKLEKADIEISKKIEEIKKISNSKHK